jgi:predicted transcriptional regulator
MDRKPTNAELKILRVLWSRGPSTVREVLHAMQKDHPVGYSTVLKLMQIMTDKQILECDKSVRPQIYTAQQSQGNTQRQLVNDLVNRAFGGSPGNLILQALSSRKSSAAEREKIRQFLDQLESAEADEDTHRSGGES